MELRVNLRRDDGIAVIAFAGEVDVYTAPVLRDAISKVLAAGDKAMVVDMSEVSFLDSTGLGVLVGRLKAVRMLDGSSWRRRGLLSGNSVLSQEAEKSMQVDFTFISFEVRSRVEGAHEFCGHAH